MLGGFGNGKIDATIASTTPLSALRLVTPGFSGNSSKNFYLNELMYRNPYLFNEVEANRIESQHDPNNPHSGNVMKKCGLKYEGTLRQADFSNKGIVDACVYSLLKDEWVK